MSVVFAIEPVSHVWNELMLLAQEHHASTTSYRRHGPFNPSFDRYHQCNLSGFFQMFTARDGQRLAGYFGVYITPSMHSQQLMATEDTFYIHPDYRGGRNALRFLKHVEKQFIEWRVHEIFFSCEIDNCSGIKGLLELLDYSPVTMGWSKILSPRADSAQSIPEQVHDVRTVTSSRT